MTRDRLPTRYRILNSLRRTAERAWTLDEVSAAEGIERSVAFEHLELLVDAELVAKQTVRRARGRPVNTYRYAGGPAGPPQRHQLLAGLLAQSLEVSPGGVERAHAVGRDFGAELGRLDRLGGEYVTSGQTVHALSCMFEATCATARNVVCSLHAGLIEGVLAGAGVKVTPLGPDGLGGCSFQVVR